MTGFDSKRQASKDLLQQALDALELARDAHCLPGPVNTLVYQSIRSISAELAQPNEWRDAIDDALICCHIGTVESFSTAQAALAALINWHVSVALDPEVSSAAQALVDRGAAQPQAEPVAWRRYNRSIGWQYEDGVTSFASDPSAEPLYAAPQAAVADEKRDRQHPLNAGNLLEIKPNGKRTERSYQSTGREGQDSSSPRSSALHASSAEFGACVTGQEADGNVSKQQAPIPLVPATAVAEPLTNEKISQCSKGNITRNGFARAIEAAHGIGIKGSAA